MQESRTRIAATPNARTSSGSLSCFISIGNGKIPLTKTRIRTPKLLLKSTRSIGPCDNNADDGNKKKWGHELRRFLPSTVFFGRRRTPDGDVDDPRDKEGPRSFSGMFRKKSGTAFLRRKLFRAASSGSSDGGVTPHVGVFGRVQNLGMQGQGGTSGGKKSKKGSNRADGSGTEEEDDDGLCRKKILLGKRCKPLEIHDAS